MATSSEPIAPRGLRPASRACCVSIESQQAPGSLKTRAIREKPVPTFSPRALGLGRLRRQHADVRSSPVYRRRGSSRRRQNERLLQAVRGRLAFAQSGVLHQGVADDADQVRLLPAACLFGYLSEVLPRTAFDAKNDGCFLDVAPGHQQGGMPREGDRPNIRRPRVVLQQSVLRNGARKVLPSSSLSLLSKPSSKRPGGCPFANSHPPDRRQ